MVKNFESLDDVLEEINRRRLACLFVLNGSDLLCGARAFMAEADFTIRFKDKDKGNYFAVNFSLEGRDWNMLCLPAAAIEEAGRLASEYGLWIDDGSGMIFSNGARLNLPLGGDQIYFLNGPRKNPVIKDIRTEDLIRKKISERLVAYT